MNAQVSYEARACKTDAERFDELKSELIALPAFRLDAWGSVGVDAVAQIDPEDFIAVGQALMQVYATHVDGMIGWHLKSRYLSSDLRTQIDALEYLIANTFATPTTAATPQTFPHVIPAAVAGTLLDDPAAGKETGQPSGGAFSNAERTSLGQMETAFAEIFGGAQ